MNIPTPRRPPLNNILKSLSLNTLGPSLIVGALCCTMLLVIYEFSTVLQRPTLSLGADIVMTDPVSSNPSANPSTHRLKTAAQWNFFGVPDDTPVAVDVDSLNETTLDLKLRGTLTSTNELSSAVIAVQGQKSQRVFLKGEITEGVTLHTVNKKEVVIRRGTVLETLTMYEPIVQAASNRPWRKQSVTSISNTPLRQVATARQFQRPPSMSESQKLALQARREKLNSNKNHQPQLIQARNF